MRISSNPFLYGGGNARPSARGEFAEAQESSLSSLHGHDFLPALSASQSGTNPVVYAGADIPGDTSTSTTITIGGSLTSELEVVGDTDWIRIELNAGDEITISLYGSGPDALLDPYVRLFDANGAFVAENDDGGSGYNSLLRFVVQTSGTYYIEADAWNQQFAGQYTLEVYETPPLDVFTYDQIAYQLTNEYWGGSARAFDISGGQITYDISALPADAQFLATEALALWGDVTGIVFVSSPGSAQMTFQDTDSGAYATPNGWNGVISSSTVNVSADWVADYGATLDSYSFQTYVHEIGHALGLGHAGNYNGNASYGLDASYANDAWATTIMSYFSQVENFYFLDQGFSYAPLTSPMLADVVAITNLYGFSATTRLGDTTYGFNSTSNRAIHDASQFPDTAYTIVDSGGTDTLDYSGFAADQLIDLTAERFMNIGGLVGNVSIGRGTIIENAIGGTGADTIDGNQAANVLQGRGNADTLYGRGNDDRLFGGGGDDTIEGNGGDDQIFGDAGNDDLFGGNADDTVTGGDGNDLITGNYGNDTLDGDAGDDRIFAGFGSDVIQGGDGRDQLYGGFDNDTLSGNQGNDMLYGGSGNDFLRGNLGADFLDGGNNDDQLYGGDADDTLEGGTGADRLYGESGHDRMFGGSGNDLLIGGDGEDLMRGGSGTDTLRGGFGADNIGGGDGDDWIEGGSGNDILEGGAGQDVFFFAENGASHADQIGDFSVAEDQIVLDQAAFSALAAGALTNAAFRTGTQALDADDRIIYDPSSGNLFYDSDGAGGAAQVLFAQLAQGLALTSGNVFVEASAAAELGPDLGPTKGVEDLSLHPEFAVL